MTRGIDILEMLDESGGECEMLEKLQKELDSKTPFLSRNQLLVSQKLIQKLYVKEAPKDFLPALFRMHLLYFKDYTEDLVEQVLTILSCYVSQTSKDDLEYTLCLFQGLLNIIQSDILGIQLYKYLQQIVKTVCQQIDFGGLSVHDPHDTRKFLLMTDLLYEMQEKCPHRYHTLASTILVALCAWWKDDSKICYTRLKSSTRLAADCDLGNLAHTTLVDTNVAESNNTRIALDFIRFLLEKYPEIIKKDLKALSKLNDSAFDEIMYLVE